MVTRQRCQVFFGSWEQAAANAVMTCPKTRSAHFTLDSDVSAKSVFNTIPSY